MSQVSNIKEIFGKFAVHLEEAELFNTYEEALAAETEFLKGAEFRAEADGFNAFAGNEGKNAKGKSNVIVAYLNWVAQGKPEAPAQEEVEAEEEAAADSVATDVETESQTEEEAESGDVNF